MDQTPNPTVRRIIPSDQVCHLTALSRTTIWRAIRSGTFPTPLRLSAGRVGWFLDEIEAWLNSRSRVRSPMLVEV